MAQSGDESPDSTFPPRTEWYSEDTSKKVSNGLLEIFENPLIEIRQQLQVLTEKQDSLLQRLTKENNSLIVCQCNPKLRDTITIIKLYKEKLQTVKKDMLALHDQAGKLKKRATRLQEQNENELQKRRLQLKREQDLIVKKECSSSSLNT